MATQAAPAPRRLVRPVQASSADAPRRVVRTASAKAVPVKNGATEAQVAATEADAPAPRRVTKAQADQAQVAARRAAKPAKADAGEKSYPRTGRGARTEDGRRVCTTEGCDQPRIRDTALKCAEHELVYREAAKARKSSEAGTAKAPAKAVAKSVAKPAAKAKVRGWLGITHDQAPVTAVRVVRRKA